MKYSTREGFSERHSPPVPHSTNRLSEEFRKRYPNAHSYDDILISNVGNSVSASLFLDNRLMPHPRIMISARRLQSVWSQTLVDVYLGPGMDISISVRSEYSDRIVDRYESVRLQSIVDETIHAFDSRMTLDNIESLMDAIMIDNPRHQVECLMDEIEWWMSMV